MNKWRLEPLLHLMVEYASRVWHDTDTLKKEIRKLLKERDDYEEHKF
ncbi:MAG: hypothetical protein LBG28_02575 [Tannerella sp.]|jgi:hypothetical protein|nr:hypothetical protein [Tannerella sp.]